MIKLQNRVEEFAEKLGEVSLQARFEVAQQILNDSNIFVREDTGELRRSSVRGSDLPRGIIGWDEPYAKRVYFTGRPSTDRNPNASLQWVEVARSRYGADWVELVLRKLKEAL